MSFEGTYFKICRNGHLWNHPVSQMGNYDQSLDECPHCKSLVFWEYIRDETNSLGEDPMYFVERGERTEKCSCCGHVSVVEPAIVSPLLHGWRLCAGWRQV